MAENDKNLSSLADHVLQGLGKADNNNFLNDWGCCWKIFSVFCLFSLMSYVIKCNWKMLYQ